MLAKTIPERPNPARTPLVDLVNPKHPLCKLAEAIDWSVFEHEFGPLYAENQGAPAKPIRLMVGLHYLKYAYNHSDESVVWELLENAYWQYFCGFEYFLYDLPLDASTLSKWRSRVGTEKLRTLLDETVHLAQRTNLLTKADLDRVNIDTTVQEKAIAFPTDARLLHKMLQKLVTAAQARGVKLRQSYVRVGKRAFVMQHRYRHANQHKRARRMLRRLRTYLGRVVRDIRRKVNVPDQDLIRLLQMADRLLAQRRNSKNKLYSLHAPEVYCIAKGKAHKRYEFGCKVSVPPILGGVTTSKSNWIVGLKSHSEPIYDAHTLTQMLDQVQLRTGQMPKDAFCDLGYRGHSHDGPTKIHLVGRHRVGRRLRRWFRRRSAIEPVIGHLKSDHRMNRNYLKGIAGDQTNAVLSACGFNVRKLLRAMGSFMLSLIRLVLGRVLEASAAQTLLLKPQPSLINRLFQ